MNYEDTHLPTGPMEVHDAEAIDVADSTTSDQISPVASAISGNDLDSLLDRINLLASGDVPPAESAADDAPAAIPQAEPDKSDASSARKTKRLDKNWEPSEPASLQDAGLTEGQLEHLALKCLGACGDLSGHALAEQHCVPFRLIEPVLHNLKLAQLVAFRASAQMNDYVYQLTDLGSERARKLTEQCSYFGSAPVTLKAYVKSVSLQTLTNLSPNQADLEAAFSDLLINKRMLRRLGPAVNSGRGMFLFGQAGNGKTSIAERITKAFGDTIWVPRCIGIDGEIMRLFDPGIHEEVPLEQSAGPLQIHAIDNRWVRIRRPTIVVGGELTMDALEVNSSTGINVSEAPLQMKSNCGTLVIDDFGRQRMTTDELLNRWIVPLEKRYDFLRLVNGKKIEVPFDQLIIFSTNLEPKDLVDDAFLRRIPYKIEVLDPSEEEFTALFGIMAPIVGVKFDQDSLNYLVATHYLEANRPFRCCQPRDLLMQIRNYCDYLEVEPEMCHEYVDYAVENYFAIM